MWNSEGFYKKKLRTFLEILAGRQKLIENIKGMPIFINFGLFYGVLGGEFYQNNCS